VSVPSRSPVSKSSSSQPPSACPGKSGGAASADGALWSFQAVLSRLQKMGIKVFRTDRDGEIKFCTDGKTMRVDKYIEAEAKGT